MSSRFLQFLQPLLVVNLFLQVELLQCFSDHLRPLHGFLQLLGRFRLDASLAKAAGDGAICIICVCFDTKFAAGGRSQTW